MAETPLDDWIFAPDHAIPLLENHFGVLVARRLWARGQTGGGFGGRGHSLLRSLHPARNARTTSTASASTNGRTTWCSTRSPCEIWS